MNEWSVAFETHSRDDVMKVCAILAKGIGTDLITPRRNRIIITGDVRNGKSVIVDGLTAAFADGMSCYKMSSESLYERRPFAALRKDLKKEFTCNGRPINNNFRHMGPLIDKPSRWFSFFEKPGINFRTFIDDDMPNDCLGIKFNGGGYLSHWHRQWQITVSDTAMQTSTMADALNHLRAFHENRQSRRMKLPENVSPP